ncbi:alkaline phosphatase [Halonatronum saccharophilum]|uniref:alkaline phosphatase n=1 Tax=Halonatronum saccharophilum TaxID=150060 RepID=UPI000488EFC9|nr:alkaline phosphatase [Halonatronum saccharophilum]
MKRIFKIIFVLSLFFILTGCPGPEVPPQEQEEAKPKNVIVLIADGMGTGHMEVARLFEYGREGKLFMETLPYVALARTYSASHNVTDSGAAGTALANAAKTNNGMIGVGPDGEELVSILDIFKEQGKTVGVVSTNTVTDATPAAYVAKTEHRGNQAEIARQIYEGEYHIALGGGERFFLPEEQDGEDLLVAFEEKGYQIPKTRDELMNIEATADTRILGLFHHSFMNYTGDREILESKEPSLLEMSEKAIEVASQNEEGFFLMLEGARVDHAAHAADFGGIWREMIEFDKAVEYAVNWAEENGDTLVIVKSDHETMGIAASEVMDVESFKEIGVSPEYMAQQLEIDEETNNYTAESIRRVFSEYANIDLDDEEIEEFQDNVWDGNDPEGRLVFEHIVGWEIGSVIAYYYDGGVMHRRTRARSDSTGGHTANTVPVLAYGVGAENFDGVLDNIEIPKMITDIFGFEYEVQGN